MLSTNGTAILTYGTPFYVGPLCSCLHAYDILKNNDRVRR